jgi:hypothetical protein
MGSWEKDQALCDVPWRKIDNKQLSKEIISLLSC